MSHYSALVVLAFTAALQTSAVLAQGTPPQVRFEVAPKIGEMVPDLTVVDDAIRVDHQLAVWSSSHCLVKDVVHRVGQPVHTRTQYTLRFFNMH